MNETPAPSIFRNRNPKENRSIEIMKLSDRILEYFKRESSATGDQQIKTQVAPASYRRSAKSVSNEVQATKIAAVFRCVDLLSNGVACLPFVKKRLNKAEGYFVTNTTPDDLTNYLIGVQPNEHQTAFEMMKNAVAQMYLLGNAYIFPSYDVMGNLESLTLCSPHTVAHDTVNDIYTINDPVNGIVETVGPDEIIHLRNFSLDGGRSGVSTVRYAAAALGIQATADNETGNLFATGGRLKGMIHNDTSVRGFGEYQDSELKKLADQIQERVSAGEDIFCLPGQAQFTPVSMSAVDMQLLEHNKFGVVEICRFFGVHPDKVFAQQSNNYKASEMSQISFLTDTLNPILRKIESEFRAKLVAPSLATDYKFAFDTSSIFTTDLTTEANYMQATINAGVMTVNEWRRRKGLRPVKGGDMTFISCNVTPITTAASKEAGKEI